MVKIRLVYRFTDPKLVKVATMLAGMEPDALASCSGSCSHLIVWILRDRDLADSISRRLELDGRFIPVKQDDEDIMQLL